MSTDLEFHNRLPTIRLQTIEVQTSQSSDVTDDNNGAIIQLENGVSDDDECQTPTSIEHKIPTILSCPPAPRKPRHAAKCKRKLSEMEFFEIVHREEVESFFRSSFEGAGITSKRRCPCK
ncbi:hypothetical protein L1049_010842 [Liquidambar formosana]|uniref:Cyclin-dependent protein kinase inhibitor SMR1 n=1 Tax=Liquidambar formosana TaxID=63359 RepID=A0AAP0X1I5_LIQFO